MDILLRATARHAGSVALRCGPTSYSYAQLLAASEALQVQLGRLLPFPRSSAAHGPRVGIWAAPGPEYVAATWAAWQAGGIAVPLATSHPPALLSYVLEDAGVSAVLTSPAGHEQLKDVAHAAGAGLHVVEPALFQQACSSSSSRSGLESSSSRSGFESSSSSNFASRNSSGSGRPESGALMLYTSGTTGKPKGVLHTHGSVSAQVSCLVQEWRWCAADTIVHALPLHHVHGVVNALYCAHAAGGAVNMLPKFSPAAVWQQLMSGQVSVLMAVPTMYDYLLSYYDNSMTPRQQADARAAAASLRLAVSGSAAAPVPLLQRWRQLSGQVLLERYGMTEAGMILSNPYQGERRPGCVGLPLPGVEVKVLQGGGSSSSSSSGGGDGEGTAGSESAAAGGVMQGELAVRGPMLFAEYWGRPDATAASFDGDGFFLTGDTVALEGQPPYFKILGRSSVDIIKSGAHKVSALQIESVLLQHADVAQAAVLGVPGGPLGETVAALVVLKAAPAPAGAAADAAAGVAADQQLRVLREELRALCAASLSPAAVPRAWLLQRAPLPRNAMGKVNKKQLLAEQAAALESAVAAAAGQRP